MKVYILTDLEGATGCYDYDYGDRTRRFRDRVFLAGDINAAIAGAYDAGSEKIVVFDGHGNDSVLLEKLDERSTLIKGSGFDSYLPGLEDGYTHLLLIGCHSMPGKKGLLSHVHSRRIRRIVLNGEEIGEIGLSLILATDLNITPAFISGDNIAVEEARKYHPAIEGVAVKFCFSEKSGEFLTPKLTSKLIYDGVKKALFKKPHSEYNLPKPPYEMRVVYKKPWIAIPRYFIKNRFKGVKIKSPYSIIYKDTDFNLLMRKYLGTYKTNNG